MLIFTNCSSDDDGVNPNKINSGVNTTQTTDLKLKIQDNLGNAVGNVEVGLYETESDWRNKQNRYSLKTTNNSGEVLFEDLKGLKYYWYAEKGCKNNYYGSITTQNNLTESTINEITTIINETGTITLQSTSSNPYRIFINGDYAFMMAGGSSHTYGPLPTGFVQVRVLQESGYILTPTEKTFDGNVQCDQTLYIEFP